MRGLRHRPVDQGGAGRPLPAGARHLLLLGGERGDGGRAQRRHAVVVADNDKPVAQFGGLGTGEFYARRTGLPWAMPPAVGTDANDLHQGEGLVALQSLLLKLMH